MAGKIIVDVTWTVVVHTDGARELDALRVDGAKCDLAKARVPSLLSVCNELISVGTRLTERDPGTDALKNMTIGHTDVSCCTNTADDAFVRYLVSRLLAKPW